MFSCYLEPTSDSVRLFEIVVELNKLGYRLQSQVEEGSDDGTRLFHVVVKSNPNQPLKGLMRDLSGIDDVALVGLDAVA